MAVAVFVKDGRGFLSVFLAIAGFSSYNIVSNPGADKNL